MNIPPLKSVSVSSVYALIFLVTDLSSYFSSESALSFSVTALSIASCRNILSIDLQLNQIDPSVARGANKGNTKLSLV